ncbi:hypothetical protein [Campylobacter sputorum]|nr:MULTISPECIES: hypothetical protein [unclassified Campylobacter]
MIKSITFQLHIQAKEVPSMRDRPDIHLKRLKPKYKEYFERD